MAEGSDQEKTEPASQKKREDARKKGQVVHSREVSSVAVLLSSMTVFFFAGGWMFQQILDIVRSVLGQSGLALSGPETTQVFFWDLFQRIILLLSPLLLVVAVTGILSNVSQVGFLVNEEAFVPKFSKLDPIKGMKRLFSLRSLIELIKSVLKMLIIGGVAYKMLSKEMDALPALMDLNTDQIMVFFGKIALKLGFNTCLVLIVLAGLDYLFQRWQFEKDLRMTKQEVKDEYKQREGDPLVRRRIRSAQREMAMRRMMADVPKATVVITNPTHLAVAIQYDRTMQAPMVLAKGAGHIAEKIKEIAQKHNIPIIEQKPLARTLFKLVDIGEFIPSDLYHAVAELLAYVYRLKGLTHNR